MKSKNKGMLIAILSVILVVVSVIAILGIARMVYTANKVDKIVIDESKWLRVNEEHVSLVPGKGEVVVGVFNDPTDPAILRLRVLWYQLENRQTESYALVKFKLKTPSGSVIFIMDPIIEDPMGKGYEYKPDRPVVSWQAREIQIISPN